MRRARLPWTAAVIVSLLVSLPVAGNAASSKDARRLYEEATSAFGLGRYAEAAEKYEAAFAARPDPALLYNAAQSYRLGGNKARALELYRNYVRLYPDGTNVEDARSHATALKKAIEDDRPPIEMARPPPAASPPTQTMPPPVETPMPTAPLPPAAPPPSGNEPSATLVSSPPPPADDRKPLTSQTWFWVAVGAAALVVGTTVILLATRDEKFPDPTFGTARGN